MKKLLPFYAILLVLVFCANEAQTQTRAKYRLKNNQIKKLIRVDLSVDDVKFPRSYLYKIRKDSLVLFSTVSDKKDEKTIFCQKTISLGDFDEMIISNRSDRIKFGLIGGAVLGAIAFAITRKATRGVPSDNNLTSLLLQDTNPAIIESVIGGITGFGLGLIIGTKFADKRINLKQSQKQVLYQLKAMN